MTEALQVVRDQLNKLAVEGSADAIALALEAQQIRALCGNANRCAVALSMLGALEEKFGEAHEFTVYVRVSGAVDVYQGDIRGRVHLGRICPDPGEDTLNLSQFIARFDCEQYPELIA